MAPQSDEQALQMATAILLVNVMRADHDVDEAERCEVVAGLARAFDLDAAAAEALAADAEREADTAISIHPLTRLLNDELDVQQRTHIVELMWRVVYADGRKDPHEELLVRRVADLLYVPHRDFINARLLAQG